MIQGLEESKWYDPEFKKISKRRVSPAHSCLSRHFGTMGGIVLSEMWFRMAESNDNELTHLERSEVVGYDQYKRPNGSTGMFEEGGAYYSKHTLSEVYPIEFKIQTNMNHGLSLEELDKDERFWNSYEGFSFVLSASNAPEYMIQEMRDAAEIVSALGVLGSLKGGWSITSCYSLDIATILTQIFWDDLEEDDRKFFIAACYLARFAPRAISVENEIKNLLILAEGIKNFLDSVGANSIPFKNKVSQIFNFSGFSESQMEMYRDFVKDGAPYEIAIIAPMLDAKTRENFEHREEFGYDWNAICLDGIESYLLSLETGWSRRVLHSIARVELVRSDNAYYIDASRSMEKSLAESYEEFPEFIQKNFALSLDILIEEITQAELPWLPEMVFSCSATTSSDLDEFRMTIRTLFEASDSIDSVWKHRDKSYFMNTHPSWIIHETFSRYQEFEMPKYISRNKYLSYAIGVPEDQLDQMPDSWINSFLSD